MKQLRPLSAITFGLCLWSGVAVGMEKHGAPRVFALPVAAANNSAAGQIVDQPFDLAQPPKLPTVTLHAPHASVRKIRIVYPVPTVP